MDKKLILIPTLALTLAITGCQNNPEAQSKAPEMENTKIEETTKVETKDEKIEPETKEENKETKEENTTEVAEGDVVPDKNFTDPIDLETALKSRMNKGGKVYDNPKDKAYDERLLNMSQNEFYRLLDQVAATNLAKKYGIELKDEDVINYTKEFMISENTLVDEGSILDGWVPQSNMFGWEKIAKSHILSYVMQTVIDMETEKAVAGLSDDQKEEALSEFKVESNENISEEEAKKQAFYGYVTANGYLKEAYRDTDYARLEAELHALKILFPDRYKKELEGTTEEEYINDKIEKGQLNPYGE